MLVYVNVSSDKGEHLLSGIIKFMLPDRPIYQVYTVTNISDISERNFPKPALFSFDNGYYASACLVVCFPINP